MNLFESLLVSNIFTSLIERNLTLQLLNNKDYYFAKQESDFFSLLIEQESNLSSKSTIEHLECALCASYKAVKKYKLHVQSLQLKEKSNMAQPTYKKFARLYNINHTILMKKYKSETQALEKVLQHWQRLTPVKEASIVN